MSTVLEPPAEPAEVVAPRAVRDSQVRSKQLTVAYLVNQYPQTSVSFVRREIAGLERAGAKVLRFAIRQWNEALVDPRDQAEEKITRRLLGGGPLRLLAAAVSRLSTHPAKFCRAALLTLKLGHRSDRGLATHAIYLFEACRLAQWCRDSGVNWLHAHFGTNSATVALLCRALGGPPFSFTVHGPEEFDRPELLKLREKIAGAEFVVGVSSFGRSQLYRWTEVNDWSKVHVVRCGLDDEFLQTTSVTPPTAPRLVVVARLHEQKGIPLLIEAAARLHRAGEPFELDIIGDGPLRSELTNQIAARGLASSVRLLGWQSSDAIRAAILSARALVLPSFAEGLPVVLMEALALGRPVIATQVAGVAELVRPNENGWLIPAGDVDALATAMRAACHASVDELSRLGQNGAKLVRERHSATTESAKLKQLIDQSLAAGR